MVLLCLAVQMATAQKDPNKRAEPIVEEGKMLYRSEMASWYGTDVFLANYTDREDIGGYFSYADGAVTKCIFYSSAEQPKVIGTITFEDSFDPEEADLDLTERTFTTLENDLATIRNAAVKEFKSDTMFKVYENTSPNFIPLINGKDKKVYILTGPSVSGVVIFGADYLITFGKNNKVESKRELHANIIVTDYGQAEEEGTKITTGMHSHLPSTGEFITATDICTLMLYSRFVGWENYYVVSKKYMNIWNCQTNTLGVVKQDVVEKIYKDQEERHKNDQDD